MALQHRTNDYSVWPQCKRDMVETAILILRFSGDEGDVDRALRVDYPDLGERYRLAALLDAQTILLRYKAARIMH